jgi:hypothetical protein
MQPVSYLIRRNPCSLRGADLSAKDVTVLRFGDRRVPRSLAGLAAHDVAAADASAVVDAASTSRRIIVLGSHADLSVVLTRLLRTDRLDVEVGFLPGRRHARRARTGAARRVPLIRDETGTVVTEAALWLPDENARAIEGEAVVDDTVLFDGEVAGVRIEPMASQPGLRARVQGGRWVTGRAVQLGTTGALVVRDGTQAPRTVRRSTFYRHTTGWLSVR